MRLIYYEDVNIPEGPWDQDPNFIKIKIDDYKTEEDIRYARGVIFVINYPKPEFLDNIMRASENVGTPIALYFKYIDESSLVAPGRRFPQSIIRLKDGQAIKQCIERFLFCDPIVGGSMMAALKRQALVHKDICTNNDGEGHTGIFITGPTGAGKTGIAKLFHATSTHFKEKFNDKKNEKTNGIRFPVFMGKDNSYYYFADWLNDTKEKEQESFYSSIDDTEKLKSDDLYSEAISVADKDGNRTTKSKTVRQTAQAQRAKFKHIREGISADWKEWVQFNCEAVSVENFKRQLLGLNPIYTGAPKGHWIPGLVLAASNNTLFLNEIGETQAELQGLLLELIERGGPFYPEFSLGNDRQTVRNVKFILSTDKAFAVRSQLLGRCLEIRVPSLAEQQIGKDKDIIKWLSKYFLSSYHACLDEIASRFIESWLYWPENVRSLKKVLKGAWMNTSGIRRVISLPAVARSIIETIPEINKSEFLWLGSNDIVDTNGTAGDFSTKLIETAKKFPWPEKMEKSDDNNRLVRKKINRDTSVERSGKVIPMLVEGLLYDNERRNEWKRNFLTITLTAHFILTLSHALTLEQKHLVNESTTAEKISLLKSHIEHFLPGIQKGVYGFR